MALAQLQTIEANEKPNDDSMITAAFAICLRTCKRETTYDIFNIRDKTQVSYHFSTLEVIVDILIPFVLFILSF